MPLPYDYGQEAPGPLMTKDTHVYHMGERSMSQDSIRTEDCDGPLPDSLETGEDMQERESDSATSGETFCTDRAELIERIKRGESPTWVPNQAVSCSQRSGAFQCNTSRSFNVWTEQDEKDEAHG